MNRQERNLCCYLCGRCSRDWFCDSCGSRAHSIEIQLDVGYLSQDVVKVGVIAFFQLLLKCKNTFAKTGNVIRKAAVIVCREWAFLFRQLIIKKIAIGKKLTQQIGECRRTGFNRPRRVWCRLRLWHWCRGSARIRLLAPYRNTV